MTALLRPRLALADKIIDGTVELPGLSAPRAVCLLARQELEVIVDDLLAAHGLTGLGNSMRPKLICLGVAYLEQPGIAEAASSAWSSLSAACHHHAYQLGPSMGEAGSLLTDVAGLGSAASAAGA